MRWSAILWIIVMAAGMGVPRTAGAQVYKWRDGNGVTHYASKPGDAQAQMADLPRITRADVKLPATGLPSCGKHGGMDCQAGADVDGSVICVDGFKDATARYRFHCKSPKLEISEITDRTPEGTFKAVVRNAKAVAAGNVSLFFTRPDGKEVPLEGPSQVKPFGMGEFVLDKADAEGLVEKPLVTQFRLVCSNCP